MPGDRRVIARQAITSAPASLARHLRRAAPANTQAGRSQDALSFSGRDMMPPRRNIFSLAAPRRRHFRDGLRTRRPARQISLASTRVPTGASYLYYIPHKYAGIYMLRAAMADDDFRHATLSLYLLHEQRRACFRRRRLARVPIFNTPSLLRPPGARHAFSYHATKAYKPPRMPTSRRRHIRREIDGYFAAATPPSGAFIARRSAAPYIALAAMSRTSSACTPIYPAAAATSPRGR